MDWFHAKEEPHMSGASAGLIPGGIQTILACGAVCSSEDHTSEMMDEVPAPLSPASSASEPSPEWFSEPTNPDSPFSADHWRRTERTLADDPELLAMMPPHHQSEFQDAKTSGVHAHYA